MTENFKIGLIEKEQGVLEKEGIFFYNPSLFSREHLFYPTWGAEYHCGKPYCVERTERDRFDAFILFYIVKGSLTFSYRDHQFSAQAGDVVLLDCKYPNQYWAEGEVRFRWFHFAGNASQAYADLLYERQGAYFPNHPDLGIHFHNLILHIRSKENNIHYLSVQLHTILGSLATLNTKQITHPAVLDAKNYMDMHFAEPVSLADLSAEINLSPYHFSRLFHAETGMPVHGYLLNVRINHAKKLLSETYDSVEAVAQQCGFSSTSHFIRAFKNAMHLTPARFRGLFR